MRDAGADDKKHGAGGAGRGREGGGAIAGPSRASYSLDSLTSNNAARENKRSLTLPIPLYHFYHFASAK